MNKNNIQLVEKCVFYFVNANIIYCSD